MDIEPYSIENNRIDDPETRGRALHHYGETTRRLFIVSAVIMLLTLPFLKNSVPAASFISIILIIGIIIVAGVISPNRIWTVVVNFAISALGVFVFEYFAVDSYGGSISFFFVSNQILAIIFMFALYFSVKFLRRTYFHEY